MLLKLVMRFEGDAAWGANAGNIIKWHKREGERVDYGDDLVDILVDEVTVTIRKVWQDPHMRRLGTNPSGYAEFADTVLRTGQLTPTAADPWLAPDEKNRLVRTKSIAGFVVRISSSDRGVIRKIYAAEGDRRQSGQLLALLTTDASESVDESEQAIEEASVFRVLANTFDSKPQGMRQANTTADELEPAKDGTRPVEPERRGIDAGRNHVIIRSDPQEQQRIGIYTYSGFTTDAMFACTSLIQQALEGHCCISRAEPIGHCRSDLILQCLNDLPEEWLQPVIDRLELDADYFRPQLCSPCFVVPGPDGPEEFPKRVVVLSTLLDAEQVLYQHREHGFLIDPGQWWYDLEQSQEWSPELMERGRWFQENFVSVGRMPVEEFVGSFERLIGLLRERAHAQVLVFNTPTVCPGPPRHSYQFVQDPRSIRRLEFNLALTELSRRLDFPIVDVDRILKRASNRSQVSWSEIEPRLYPWVAQEAFGIMRELGVFQ
jgi:hypothetical protein